jgi:hypothetical protein
MAGEESHEVKRRRVDRERVVRTLTFWLRPEFVLRVVNRFQKVAGFDRSVALASSALTATIPLAILTSWDRPRATDGSVRTGNAPTTTCSALSEALVSASTAGTRARSKKRTQEPPRRCSVSSNWQLSGPSSEERETAPFVKQQQCRAALPLLVRGGRSRRCAGDDQQPRLPPLLHLLGQPRRRGFGRKPRSRNWSG